jgi:hypothetical protein
MVEITPEFGNANRNFGNKLFTYAVGRIFAIELGQKLVLPEMCLIQRSGNFQEFPYKGTEGEEISDIKNQYYVSDHNLLSVGLENSIYNSIGRWVVLDGYFLRYEYIKKYKSFVKEIYKDLVLENDGKNDVVIMLRDSNCDGSFKIEDSYYLNILETLSFDNLYICFDHRHKHQTLFQSLSKYEPILVDEPILDVFKFITSKNTIIACQGTFSFWAAFLSKAKKIYWPITKVGPNSMTDFVDLRVDDEDRFEMVNI